MYLEPTVYRLSVNEERVEHREGPCREWDSPSSSALLALDSPGDERKSGRRKGQRLFLSCTSQLNLAPSSPPRSSRCEANGFQPFTLLTWLL